MVATLQVRIRDGEESMLRKRICSSFYDRFLFKSSSAEHSLWELSDDYPD